MVVTEERADRPCIAAAVRVPGDPAGCGEAGDDALTAGARWPMAIDAVYGQGLADDDEQRPD
jgi:hypothetical protein